MGGDLSPPSADTVVSLLQRSDASIVVDLSGLTSPTQEHYLRNFPAEIEVSRRANGRPHWLFVDEAHQIAGRSRPALGAINPASKGNCLITWRPGELPADVLASMDVVLAMTSPNPDDALVDLTAAVCGQSAAAIAAMLTGPTGRVVVAGRHRPARLVWLGARATTHFRHDHKYSAAGMPADRRFWFRIDAEHLTGANAANLGQLESELAHCDRAAIRHHAARHDFSRWIAEVFHDDSLADAILAAERTITENSPTALTEAGRLALVAALRARRPR